MIWFGGGRKQRGASPQRRPHERSRDRDLARQQREAQKQRAKRRRELEKQQRAQQKIARRSEQAGPEHDKPRRTARLPKPRGEWQPIAWERWGERAMPALALSLVGALALGGWWMLHAVGSKPVSRVLFTGELKHVDRDELVSRTQPLLTGEGFMTVDLEAIRAELLQMPWVAEVSVRRQWPSHLVVAVVEQVPIARWGDDGLLNRRGQVFRPLPLGAVDDLPVLFGPDAVAADVVARYADLSALLAAEGLRLVSLGTDQRGSWRAELDGGVQLRLGTGELLDKLRRFARVYRAELQPRFAEVAYVDLRYSNGLAIGWRAPAAQAGTAPTMRATTTMASATKRQQWALDTTKRTLGEQRNG
jgi:cell division protein FtsQ